MAATDTCDSLAVAEELEAAGFEKNRTRTAASAVRDSRAGLATGADLGALRAELKTGIANLETRPTVRLYGAAAGIAAAVAAAAVSIVIALLALLPGGAP